jgi:hypothetical protein
VFVEGFGGCSPAEGLAGSGVECRSDGLDLFRVPARQVSAFREVLTQQPVRVLVGSALPRASWIREEQGNAGLDPEGGMGGESLQRSHVSERRAHVLPSQVAGQPQQHRVRGGRRVGQHSRTGRVDRGGRILGQRLDQLDVLSIGTTSPLPDFGDEADMGLVGWGPKIISLLMTAQAQGSVAMAQVLCGGGLHRMDATVPKKWLTMDNVSRVKELISSGRAEATKAQHVAVVQERFLNGVKVEPFTPVSAP